MKVVGISKNLPFLNGHFTSFSRVFFSFIKKERYTIIIFVISKEKFLEVDTFYYVEKSHIKEASLRTSILEVGLQQQCRLRLNISNPISRRIDNKKKCIFYCNFFLFIVINHLTYFFTTYIRTYNIFLRFFFKRSKLSLLHDFNHFRIRFDFGFDFESSRFLLFFS